MAPVFAFQRGGAAGVLPQVCFKMPAAPAPTRFGTRCNNSKTVGVTPQAQVPYSPVNPC